MFLPFVGILKLIMTERNEAASERLALSTVKSEVLTHELSMGDRELGLQPVPLPYSQQVGLPVCSVQYTSTTAYYLQLSTTKSTKQCPCSYLVNSTEVNFCTILLSFCHICHSVVRTYLTLFVSIFAYLSVVAHFHIPEDASLLGCDMVLLGVGPYISKDCIAVHFQGTSSSRIFLGLLDPRDDLPL